MKNKIEQIALKISILEGRNLTEEPTKMAIIVPFLQILGYDVFDPDEIIPQYTSDFGTKKGEKVDYAILKNNEPSILIECKPLNAKMDIYSSQLFRYYTVSKAKYGILTNGKLYNFYTDIKKSNIMDDVPFLSIDITKMSDSDYDNLLKFHKQIFDPDRIFNDAIDLKNIIEIRNILRNEIVNPSVDFVKFFTSKIYTGKNTENVINRFSILLKKSFETLFLDEFDKNLNKNKNENIEATKDKIETTNMEIESYYLIKHLLKNNIDDTNRIKYKDTMNYLNIFIDTPHNTLCRLYLNGNKKFVTLDKKESERYYINQVDDLYSMEKQIIEKGITIINEIKNTKLK